MKPSSKPLDPAVRKLVASATANASAGMQHDPALLKALAEASAWIVTLHGPDRTPAVERGFQQWLAESELNRYSFEHATDTWNQARAAVRQSAQVNVSAPAAKRALVRNATKPVWLALAASLAALAIVIVVHVQRQGLETAVGERRTLVLEDGTQVSMNTATRISLHFDEHRRHVRLSSGEALFEVAKHSSWPFVVTAGDRDITALGTAFLVRHDAAQLAVTLVEGKVAVTEAGEASERQPEAEAPVTLMPGQRVVFSERTPPRLDRPQVEKLTAWQQGLVNIDDLTMAQAVDEMNRYNAVRLAVEGPAAELRVSGVFRVTDVENFAQALALTYGLDVRRERRRIVLSGVPHPANEASMDRNLKRDGHDSTH